ncbi:hypothetical protein [Methylobacterium nodulans]|uniref:Uncharacterized protein n=1 Tax=Methylobacterium nodulans (strain LMG 21967 / CNCM I-2342 / ORS 2060) TaxID=460265 RepID=B8IVS8_METNO|nr:hypothetical protein [Methylobacterium nodulans]ACL62518.1 hypothetical protein Mnod_8391 [Methylobacterium nodulans ORS 2060]
MTHQTHLTASHSLDYDRTLILVVEVSARSWVVAAQVPGLRQKSSQQQLAPQADALMGSRSGDTSRTAPGRRGDGAEAGLTVGIPRAARWEGNGPAEPRRMRIDGSGQTRRAELARWDRGSGGRDEAWAA